MLRSFFYFQFLFLEHLQTSSDIGVLIIKTELFPLTDVLYTFYEHFMFSDIMFFLFKNKQCLDWIFFHWPPTNHNSDWLINIQLCTMRHTLMAAISNRVSVFVMYLSKQSWLITCEFSHCLGQWLMIFLFVCSV